MKTTITLWGLAALTAAQNPDLLPVHGCLNMPNTTTITNFTFVHHPRNLGIKAFVQWESPRFSISCYGESPTASGANVPIGFPGTYTSIPCKGSQNGGFQVATDGVNASVEFSTWQQCAASQYYFHYKADIVLECKGDDAGVLTCGDGDAKEGNSTAGFESLEWLQPIRPPPPPPFVYVPPSAAASATVV
ncbi:hypothetical protein IQ06DRAFT_381116 [Phaeosphaeriaceae sp. SRC1lsM3a]|nr:hypothetical protein IQ06DRAFT_381116 [Stagonospora sp. SRC1lsM3a]